jgi:hypothetical protein
MVIMMWGATHNMVINPNPKMAVPTMGIMKWALAWADQPYQLTWIKSGIIA